MRQRSIVRTALTGAVAAGAAAATLVAPGVASADDTQSRARYVDHDFVVHAEQVRHRDTRDGYRAVYELTGRHYDGRAVVTCEEDDGHGERRATEYDCEVTSRFSRHHRYVGSVYATFSYEEGDDRFTGQVKDGDRTFEDARGWFRARTTDDEGHLRVRYHFRSR